MCSCVAAVEALFVDEINGGGSGAVEQHPLVVCVFVLHLHLFLHQLVALPQCRVLDSFNLPTQLQHMTHSHCIGCIGFLNLLLFSFSVTHLFFPSGGNYPFMCFSEFAKHIRN